MKPDGSMDDLEDGLHDGPADAGADRLLPEKVGLHLPGPGPGVREGVLAVGGSTRARFDERPSRALPTDTLADLMARHSPATAPTRRVGGPTSMTADHSRPAHRPLAEEDVVRSSDDRFVRRPDGSIDEDHYVRLAHRLRAEQLRKLLAAALTGPRSLVRWMRPDRLAGRMARTRGLHAATGMPHGGLVADGAKRTGRRRTAAAAVPPPGSLSPLKGEEPC